MPDCSSRKTVFSSLVSLILSIAQRYFLQRYGLFRKEGQKSPKITQIQEQSSFAGHQLYARSSKAACRFLHVPHVQYSSVLYPTFPQVLAVSSSVPYGGRAAPRHSNKPAPLHQTPHGSSFRLRHICYQAIRWRYAALQAFHHQSVSFLLPPNILMAISICRL